jgi:transposase
MITIRDLWRFRKAKIVRDEIDLRGKRIFMEVAPDRRFKAVCAHCGGRILVHQHENRVIRDIPLWDFSVFIDAHYRKGHCCKCGKIVVEHLEYTKPGLRMTSRLAEYILGLGKKMSDADIARVLGLSWKVVHKVHYEALLDKYDDMDYGNPRLLAVDEIAVRKGHKYATVIVDIEKGRVLSIEEDRTTESLMSFYRKLSQKQREGIEAVAMDEWDAYISATEQMLPNAEIVTDYFHMVKKYNKEVIDKVRTGTAKSIGILVDKRDIIKGSRFLLYKRKDKLTNSETTQLEHILGTNQPLYIAYTLKDMLHAIFGSETINEAIDRAQMFMRMAVESQIKPIKEFAGKVAKNIRYIANHAKFKITTGIIEGINNKIKNIKRRAYGIKDIQFLKLLAIDAFY